MEIERFLLSLLSTVLSGFLLESCRMSVRVPQLS